MGTKELLELITGALGLLTALIGLFVAGANEARAYKVDVAPHYPQHCPPESGKEGQSPPAA
jgi:hypothetical protein